MHEAAHDFKARFTHNGIADFKFRGAKLMRKVRKWAKKWPDQVHLLHSDDSHAMGSMIVLIEHKNEEQWYALTGYIIPQAEPEMPVEFCLNPFCLAEVSSKLQLILQLACMKEIL